MKKRILKLKLISGVEMEVMGKQVDMDTMDNQLNSKE
jgi:hypothetical protein